MQVSNQRSENLNELADAIRPLFPSDARCSRAPDVTNYFRVSWGLQNQPEDLTQRSREISISFPESELVAYEMMNSEEKAQVHENLRSKLALSLVGYSEGREFKRYAAKNFFRVEMHLDRG